MRLRTIYENKNIFDYQEIANKMWREKTDEARDMCNISFDTENDESIESKNIDIGENKFACEMRSAGGDWEYPLRYFRCQLLDGYADGRSKYTDPYFVFIPNDKEGNGQLVKRDGKLWCPDADEKVDESLRDENKCWDSLEEYLDQISKIGPDY